VDSVLGLPNPFNGAGWPAISGTSYGTTYSASTPRKNVTNVYNGQENLTKSYGRHRIQFGGGIRFEHDNVLPQQQQVRGSDSFGSNYTALYNPASGTAYQAINLTGSQAAEMYMGLLETYNNTFARSYYLWRYQEYSLCAQDEFKLHNRLTMSYGLRYEYRPPISEARDNIMGFDKAKDAVVLALSEDQMIQKGYTVTSVYNQFLAIGMKTETPQQAGVPHNMVYPNKHDFGPRAGLAWAWVRARGPRFCAAATASTIFRFPALVMKLACAAIRRRAISTHTASTPRPISRCRTGRCSIPTCPPAARISGTRPWRKRSWRILS
jgi:hypothetical protein